MTLYLQRRKKQKRQKREEKIIWMVFFLFIIQKLCSHTNIYLVLNSLNWLRFPPDSFTFCIFFLCFCYSIFFFLSFLCLIFCHKYVCSHFFYLLFVNSIVSLSGWLRPLRPLRVCFKRSTKNVEMALTWFNVQIAMEQQQQQNHQIKIQVQQINVKHP